MRIEKARVFLSFDPVHDQDLHDRLLAESKKGSLFSIEARSQRSDAANADDERVRAQIVAADAVIVICGEHTHESPGVAAELRITQESAKPHLLLWGRREIMCKKPAGARNDDSMYGWTTENLTNQIQIVMRAGRPREGIEHLRRQTGPPKPPRS